MAVDASRPPSLNTKTPATVISLIKALADAPLSRSSSNVSSGTHSSLNAIRYSAISSSSAHGQPGRLPLTFSTKALVPIRHPAQDFFQPSAAEGRSPEGRALDAWNVGGRGVVHLTNPHAVWTARRSVFPPASCCLRQPALSTTSWAASSIDLS